MKLEVTGGGGVRTLNEGFELEFTHLVLLT